MRAFELWHLDANGTPVEVKLSRYGDLNEQRMYRDNLQRANPRDAYWIKDRHTGKVVF